MSEWIRVEAINAGELMEHFEIEDASAAVLHPELNPEGGVLALVEAGCYYDAIKLLAHGLPKREAVWWACLVARQVQNPDTDQGNIDALIAAEEWARQPSEENRLKCRVLAEKTKYETPASWAATAASWSTGSLAAEGEPDIEPPKYLYAHAVAGSVTLAGMLKDPDDPETCLYHYIQQGSDLARGGQGSI